MTPNLYTLDPADEESRTGSLIASLATEPDSARGAEYYADLAAAYAAHGEYLAASAPPEYWEASACLDALRGLADSARHGLDHESAVREYTERWTEDLKTLTGQSVPIPDNAEALRRTLATMAEHSGKVLARLAQLRDEDWPDDEETRAWQWVHMTKGRLPGARANGTITRKPAEGTDEPAIEIKRHLHGGVRITLELSYEASLKAVDVLVDGFDL